MCQTGPADGRPRSRGARQPGAADRSGASSHGAFDPPPLPPVASGVLPRPVSRIKVVPGSLSSLSVAMRSARLDRSSLLDISNLDRRVPGARFSRPRAGPAIRFTG
ncbi:MAG: hypothetical protein AMXMBFR72_27940 [Betaproteobacteria bacterium]